MKLVIYKCPDGSEPFVEWMRELRDRRVKQRIEARINRIREGNFGDSRSVGEGVSELRLHFGPGYRVYFGREGDDLVLLLCAGEKSTQKRDIEKAKAFWLDYKRGK